MSTVLITGSNRGIGLALCRGYAARGDQVVACCRHTNDALGQLGVRLETGVDVSSDEAVDRLATRLADTELDVLVLNAGISEADSLTEMRLDAVRLQLEVNAIAPLRVVRALLPRLRRGAKIGIITSRMGSMADNTSGGYYGYRMSKAAVNAMGVSLARDLAGRGISVVLLHPGWVRTDMTGGSGLVDADASAAGLIARLDELTPERSGSFLHMNGEPLPW